MPRARNNRRRRNLIKMAANDVKPNGLPRLPHKLTSGSDKCTVCGEPGATLCCSDCNSLDLGAVCTRYCTQACQDEDWPSHKVACRERRRLFRAVRLLVFFWETLSSITFSKPIEYKNHEYPGYVRVTIDTDLVDPDLWTGKPIFRNFADVIVPDDIHETVRRAILHHGSSQEAMVFAAGFIHALISPICRRIQESRLEPGRRAIVVQHVEKGSGSNKPLKTPTLPYHGFLKVDLMTGGSFGIDLAGGQFGWEETVYHWRHCQYRAKDKRIKLWSFGGHSRLDYLSLIDLLPSEPMRAAAELRMQTAMGMCHDFWRFLIDKKVHIRGFLSQANDSYAVQSEELLAFIKTRAGERIHDLTVRRGIGRMFFFPDKYGGHTRVIRKQATFAKMKNLWFTQEEVDAKKGDKDALASEWQARLNRMEEPFKKIEVPAAPQQGIPTPAKKQRTCNHMMQHTCGKMHVKMHEKVHGKLQGKAQGHSHDQKQGQTKNQAQGHQA